MKKLFQRIDEAVGLPDNEYTQHHLADRPQLPKRTPRTPGDHSGIESDDTVDWIVQRLEHCSTDQINRIRVIIEENDPLNKDWEY